MSSDKRVDASSVGKRVVPTESNASADRDSWGEEGSRDSERDNKETSSCSQATAKKTRVSYRVDAGFYDVFQQRKGRKEEWLYPATIKNQAIALCVLPRRVHDICSSFLDALGFPCLRWVDETAQVKQSYERFVEAVIFLSTAKSRLTAKYYHDEWVNSMKRNGWHCGPSVSEERREHPLILPYDQLPYELKERDSHIVMVSHSVVSLLEEVLR